MTNLSRDVFTHARQNVGLGWGFFVEAVSRFDKNLKGASWRRFRIFNPLTSEQSRDFYKELKVFVLHLAQNTQYRFLKMPLKLQLHRTGLDLTALIDNKSSMKEKWRNNNICFSSCLPYLSLSLTRWLPQPCRSVLAHCKPTSIH